MIDLDDFKQVNDTLGHPVGDDLLVEVGRRLRSATRGGDTVARLGGDEFAVLVEAGDPEQVAHRVLRQLSEPLVLADRPQCPTGSIGVVVIAEEDEVPTAAEVLQRADLAMYAAKRTGKGTVRRYTADMSEQNTGYADMRAALRRDIRNERIDVAFQPIYLTDGTLHGVEVLARWAYAGQVVPPAVFLPIARDIDLIADLDEAVLRVALAKLPAGEQTTLWVNIDSRTLPSAHYADHVADILLAADFPAARLCVEVLESGVIEHDTAAARTLAALRAQGVHIVVNDFGAGYAALARMRALRPDIVKINRTLLGGHDDTTAAALLDDAAALARQIGAVVVAEGIETSSQLDAALEAGCDAVQGFLLARPDAYPNAAGHRDQVYLTAVRAARRLSTDRSAPSR